MEPLTEKQQRLLAFIESCLRDNNPPSQKEMARHFGLSRTAIRQLLGYLKKKGYLADTGGHRGLRLSQGYLAKARQKAGIPVVGRVAAGEPILAEENIEGYIDLKELFSPSKDAFILKVTGDSMIDEGIMDGDFVVVEPTSVIKNGQIGVVLLDDEATVKKVYIRGNRIALKSANHLAGYKTRYIKKAEKDVRIIGKVVGCFRLLAGTR